MSNEVTSEGARLIKEWLAAQESLENARRVLSARECDLSNTKIALARWMLPQDAKPGEQIAVWFGDSLIQVTCAAQGYNDHGVKIRTRGREPLR